MANPVKGEVPFEHNGKSYIFKFGTNTQAIIESRVNKSVGAFMAEKAESFGASDLRLVFWAGLFQKHQLTEDEVGDMIDDLGPEKVSEILWTAVKAATTRKANGADEHPPMPTQERIGMNS